MKFFIAFAAAFLCVFPAQSADAPAAALIQAILDNDIAGLKARLDAGANPMPKANAIRLC